MILKQLHFYRFDAVFHHVIKTPRIEMAQRPTLIIGITDEEGNEWFGECNAFETDWYHFETIDSVMHTLQLWFQRVKGRAIESFKAAQDILQSLDSKPAARATAMMALYQAFHDLSTFQVQMTTTMNGDLSQRIINLEQTGRIKIKWNTDILDQVKWLSSMYPDIPISTDANQTLTTAHYDELKQLQQSQLAFIEEPFLNFEDIDQNQVMPPIAIDEKATNLSRIEVLIDDYPISVVVIKPFRIGGIDRVVEMIRKLQNKGIKVVIGGVYELGLSRYFTAYLSQFGDYAGDVTPHGYYFKDDIVNHVGKLQNGRLTFDKPYVDKQQLTYLFSV